MSCGMGRKDRDTDQNIPEKKNVWKIAKRLISEVNDLKKTTEALPGYLHRSSIEKANEMEEVEENVLEASAMSYDDVRKRFICLLCKSLKLNLWGEKHLNGKQHTARLNAFNRAFLILEKQPFCKLCNRKVVWEKVEDHAVFHKITPFWEPEDKHQRFFANFLMRKKSLYYCHLCKKILQNWCVALSHLEDEDHLELRQNIEEYELEKQWDIHCRTWVTQGITPGRENKIECRICDVTMDPSQGESHIILPRHVRNRLLHWEDVLEREKEKKLDESSKLPETTQCDERIAPKFLTRPMICNFSIGPDFSSTSIISEAEQDESKKDSYASDCFSRINPKIDLGNSSDLKKSREEPTQFFEETKTCNNSKPEDQLFSNFLTISSDTASKPKVFQETEKTSDEFLESQVTSNGENVSPSLHQDLELPDQLSTSTWAQPLSEPCEKSTLFCDGPEPSIADPRDNDEPKDLSSNNFPTISLESTPETEVSENSEFGGKDLSWVIKLPNKSYNRLPLIFRKESTESTDKRLFCCFICLDHFSDIEITRKHISDEQHKNAMKKYGCDRIVIDEKGEYHCTCCNRSKQKFVGIYDHLKSDGHAKNLKESSLQSNGQSVSVSAENKSIDSEEIKKQNVDGNSKAKDSLSPNVATIHPGLRSESKVSEKAKKESGDIEFLEKDLNWVIRISNPVYKAIVPVAVRQKSASNMQEKVFCCLMCFEYFANVDTANKHISDEQHKNAMKKYGCDRIVIDEKGEYHCTCCNRSKQKLFEIYCHLKSDGHAKKLKESSLQSNGESVSVSAENKSIDSEEIKKRNVDGNSKAKDSLSSNVATIHPGLRSESKVSGEAKKESGDIEFLEKDLNWVIRISNPVYKAVVPVDVRQKSASNMQEKVFCCLMCFEYFANIETAKKHIFEAYHVNHMKQYGCHWIEKTKTGDYYCACCNRTKKKLDQIYNHLISRVHVEQHEKHDRSTTDRSAVISTENKSTFSSEKSAPRKRIESSEHPRDNELEKTSTNNNNVSQPSSKKQFPASLSPACDKLQHFVQESTAPRESPGLISPINPGFSSQCVFAQKADKSKEIRTVKNDVLQPRHKGHESLSPNLLPSREDSCNSKPNDEISRNLSNISPGPSQSLVNEKTKKKFELSDEDLNWVVSYPHALFRSKKFKDPKKELAAYSKVSSCLICFAYFNSQTVKSHISGKEHNKLLRTYGCHYIEVTPESKYRCLCCNVNERYYRAIYMHVMSDVHVERAWEKNRMKKMQFDVELEKSGPREKGTNDCSSQNVAAIEPSANLKFDNIEFREEDLSWVVSRMHALCVKVFRVRGKTLVKDTGDRLFYCLICQWPEFGSSFDSDAVKMHIESEMHVESMKKYGCTYIRWTKKLKYCCKRCNVQKLDFQNIYGHTMSEEHAKKVRELDQDEDSRKESESNNLFSSNVSTISQTSKVTAENLGFRETDLRWVVDVSDKSSSDQTFEELDENSSSNKGDRVFHCYICFASFSDVEIAESHVSSDEHVDWMEKYGCRYVVVTPSLKYHCKCCDRRKKSFGRICAHIMGEEHAEKLRELDRRQDEQSIAIYAKKESSEISYGDGIVEQPFDDDSESINLPLIEKTLKNESESNSSFSLEAPEIDAGCSVISKISRTTVEDVKRTNESTGWPASSEKSLPPEENTTLTCEASTSSFAIESCIFVSKENAEKYFCHICEDGQLPVATKNLKDHINSLQHKLSLIRYGCSNIGTRKDGSHYCSFCDCQISNLRDVYLHVKNHMSSLVRVKRESKRAREVTKTVSTEKFRCIFKQRGSGQMCKSTFGNRDDLHAHMAKHFSKELVAKKNSRRRKASAKKKRAGSNEYSMEFSCLEDFESENRRIDGNIGRSINQNSVAQNSLCLQELIASKLDRPLIKFGDSSSSESESESGEAESEKIAETSGWDLDQYLTSAMREKKSKGKMKLKNIMEKLNFRDDDIYQLDDKLSDLILGLRMSMIIDNETIYCLICRVRVSNTFKDYYTHLWSLDHCNYLDVMENDAEEFANFPDQFSDLDLAHEYMEEISDATVCCYLCNKSVDNENESLRDHVYEKEHERARTLTRSNALTIYESMQNSLKCDWYGIERYSCFACRIYTESEVSFVKHLKSDKHFKKMLESPNFERKMLLDYCPSCAVLWYGYRSSHFYHVNEVETHEWLANDGFYLMRDIPKFVQRLLQQPENWADRTIRHLDGIRLNETFKGEALVDDLEKIVRATFPSAKAYTFGSRVTGLNSEDSDIDIFLDCRNVYDGKGTSDTITMYFICEVFECLSTIPETWDVHEVLANCRSPIIRAYHRPTGLACDISFDNGLCVEKTKLIKRIVDVYPAFRKLVVILKMWMSYCDLAGSERIAHNTLYWLVIFYLQNETILPSIATLISMENKSKIIAGWEVGVSYDFDPWKPDGSSSVKDLLERFFTFYANFNFRHDVVCPLLGEAIKKTDFVYSENLPKEMNMYVKYMRKSKKQEMLRIDSPMCIQDPFDLPHNVTKAVRKNVLNRFRTCCSKSLDVMASS